MNNILIMPCSNGKFHYPYIKDGNVQIYAPTVRNGKIEYSQKD